MHPALNTLLLSNCWAAYQPWLEALSLTKADSPQLDIKAAANDIQQASGVAVIPIMGAVMQRTDPLFAYFGIAQSGHDYLRAQLQVALSSKRVSSILLYVDSPGGDVMGTPETAEMIAEVNKQKKVVAYTEGLNASAAYHLTSQASEIWASKSSLIGSIGVYTMHVDYSQLLENDGVKVTFIQAGKNKTEGNPYEPLSDEAKAETQRQVNDYYSMMLNAIAAGRGVSVEKVESDFGQGRVFIAEKAQKLGLIDKVGTLSECLQSIAPKSNGLEGKRKAAMAQIEIANLT